MSLSIVTFANLGEKQNLKTAGILPVIETLSNRGELIQVVCQVERNFYFPDTSSAVPRIVRYPLRAFEKVFGKGLSRETTENLFDFFAARKLRKADVTLIHPALFARTIAVAKRLASTAVGVVTTAHPLFAASLFEEENRLLGLPERQYLEATDSKLVVNRFDYLVAISDFAKSTLAKYSFSPDRIFVAYTDIDTKRFIPKEREDDVFRVLYVAYTTPLKGLHYLLDAWNTLQLPNAELVLVGGYGDMPGELKRDYERKIARNRNIVQIGNEPKPERQYNRSSVFVLPSLTEGNPRVVMEAMACGIPVVTTENARSIVEDGKTGFVVPIRDSKAIAEKIQYMYDHRAETQAMGKAARQAVETKKPFGEAVYEIYQEIMRREKKV